MRSEPPLTAERLREVLDYNPETGVFVRRVRSSQNTHVGDVAGGADGKGYWRVRVDGRRIKAHQLAWLYMTGEWPRHEIDHADCDGLNNAWSNLRQATRAQNMANRTVRRGSRSGIKGVTFYKRNQWKVAISVNGKKKHLGLFECVGAAQLAYALAAIREHGEYARQR